MARALLRFRKPDSAFWIQDYHFLALGAELRDLHAVGGEHLGVEVLTGAQHGQARHAEFADMRAGGFGAAQTGGVLDAAHDLDPWEADRPIRPSWLPCE